MAREDPRGVPSIPTSRQTWRAGAEDAVADPSRRLADLEADLMALAAADDDLERDAEIAERIRIERAGVTWSARWRATHDSVVVVTTVGSVTGIPVECEQAWLGLRGAHEEVVVSTASVVCIAGLGSMAGSTPAETVARSFASIMRAWCRDRSIVEVRLDSRETSTLAVGTGVEPATMRSVGVLHGRLVAAYADHLDLRLDPEAHADWSDRVLAPVISIPYAGIAVVRRSWEPSPVWAP